MFFTTALMTLAVEAITFKNFYSHSYGVIEEETIMFFLTAFFVPLIWFIHPYNVYKNIQYIKNKDKFVSQKHAN
jgi:membrane protein CcdC involved in cytochrome C biogenesis